MLRLINAHNFLLPKKAITAFWHENKFQELISINGSDYQIAKCEETDEECFLDPESINVFYLIDDKNPRTIIGFVKINIENNLGAIMFSIVKEYQKREFYNKLCKLLINKCWRKGLEEIHLIFSDYNIPMEIIAQEKGFNFIGYSGVGTECDGLGHLNYSLKNPKKKVD